MSRIELVVEGIVSRGLAPLGLDGPGGSEVLPGLDPLAGRSWGREGGQALKYFSCTDNGQL